MVAINEEFFDVDFDAVAPPGMMLGALPRFDAPGDVHPIYEEHFDLIPESDWKGLIEIHESMEPLCREIKDQNGEGSCTSNQETLKWEMTFFRQFGEWITLSPISLYKQVANGPNTGSTLPDNAYKMHTIGALPVDTVHNRAVCERLNIGATHFFPSVGFHRKFPPNWENTAQFFRNDEQYDVISFEGLTTAILRHHLPGYARDSHCILGVDPIWDPNKGYVIKYANSWKSTWGDKGFGYDSRSIIEQGMRRYRGGTVLRSVFANFVLVT